MPRLRSEGTVSGAPRSHLGAAWGPEVDLYYGACLGSALYPMQPAAEKLLLQHMSPAGGGICASASVGPTSRREHLAPAQLCRADRHVGSHNSPRTARMGGVRQSLMRRNPARGDLGATTCLPKSSPKISMQRLRVASTKGELGDAVHHIGTIGDDHQGSSAPKHRLQSGLQLTTARRLLSGNSARSGQWMQITIESCPTGCRKEWPPIVQATTIRPYC